MSKRHRDVMSKHHRTTYNALEKLDNKLFGRILFIIEVV